MLGLFAYYHFGKTDDLIVEVVSFLYFVDDFSLERRVGNGDFGDGFVFFHVEIGVDALHGFQASGLQGGAELGENQLDTFLDLGDITGILQLFFGAVAIIQYVEQGDDDLFACSLTQFEVFPGATFSEVVEFGEQAEVFILLFLDFFLQAFELFLPGADIVEAGGACYIFICVQIIQVIASLVIYIVDVGHNLVLKSWVAAGLLNSCP